MSVLISIHDVAPPFERQVRELWSICFAAGARPALLVVPNWHGAYPLPAHRRFVDWIYARTDQGAKVLLHGERHDEALSRRRALDHLRAAGRTAREGEFLALTYDQARQRIDRGLATLLGCGLSPIGFVPPAWLSRECTRDAARDAGLTLSEDERCVYLLQRGVTLDAPVLRWSARSIWRARASAVVADVRWQVQRNVPVMRIALHPADMDDPRSRASLQRALERWLGDRPATSYGTLAMGSSFDPRAA